MSSFEQQKAGFPQLISSEFVSPQCDAVDVRTLGMPLFEAKTIFQDRPKPMKRILIVEDQPTDLRLATEVVQNIGFQEVEARTTTADARVCLDEAIEGKQELPDVILLDLDLGYESGYELLRFWYKNPNLAKVRMVVWTALGSQEREMCKLFGVHEFVPKWEGTAGLKKTLGAISVVADGGPS